MIAVKNIHTGGPTSQRGLGIVELMIAMTLGILISGAVGTAYVQGVRSHAQDERYVQMIENGRYALDRMARDLQMIEFWGEMLDAGGISTGLAAGEDCDVGLLDGAASLLFNNVHAGTSLFNMTADACPSLTGTIAPGTSQLAVKHVNGTAVTTGQTDGLVYLRSNGVSATFINTAASTALPAGFRDWLYEPAVYYIRNEGNGPRLCRLAINGLALGALAEDECLADGVEQFHLQFGVDTDSDGVANQYKSNPTAAEVGDVVSVRAFVLVRSMDDDPQYVNTKSYVLGDLVVPAANDNFYRRVFNTTVLLRNPKHLALLN